MYIIHLVSWLFLLALVPPTLWIIWIKNRSSVNSWVRRVGHPDRWLLSTELPSQATKEDIRRALRDIVSESKNTEWNASCAYKRRNPQSGTWTIGLISNKKPINKNTSRGYAFRKIPTSRTVRLSCPVNQSNSDIKSDLIKWATKNDYRISDSAVSLSAQSYQCWEWDIEDLDKNSGKIPLLQRLSERIFEMREIALYPTLITIIAIFLCGTGNYWLFGIGIFTVILMSGAHKFVFMYQREDITQEDHLQNY